MTENSAHEMANGACLIRFKKKANDGGCTSFQFLHTVSETCEVAGARADENRRRKVREWTLN